MDTAELSFLPFLADPVPQAEPRVGCRLHRLEVFNWGTFDGKIWPLVLDGKNALLTGDIGSGKSTLVDAVTTLLLAPHRIAYNKAAGAERAERSLRTYVLGHYKSERSEESGAAKPKGLRDQSNYSVVLGIFHNEGFNETTTLAQVFWFKDSGAQPERFYVVANCKLSIAADFANIGPDMAQLKKRLRAAAGVEVHDSFSSYAAVFRRRFHATSEQAWELFHQTVSMKSVGRLTDFVREHMLPPSDVQERIADLLAHFEDLTEAHAAVAKAKDQVAMLQPLVSDCDQYKLQTEEHRFLTSCRDQLNSFFAARKVALLDQRLQYLSHDRTCLLTRKERRQEQKVRESDQVQMLRSSY